MWVFLSTLLACGPATKPYGDDVALGTACITVEGAELCAKRSDILAERTDDGFVVEAVVDVPDREIGYDQALLRLESDGSGGQFAALAPVAIDCLKVAAHGDHCHPEVETFMSCELPVAPKDGEVMVDRFDDDSLYARFEATVDIELPSCCSNDCDFSTEPEASPSGPYRITGVVHVSLTEATDAPPASSSQTESTP